MRSFNMLGVLCRDRQLQHRGGLASDQPRENLPIGELQRIVLNVRIVQELFGDYNARNATAAFSELEWE